MQHAQSLVLSVCSGHLWHSLDMRISDVAGMSVGGAGLGIPGWFPLTSCEVDLQRDQRKQKEIKIVYNLSLRACFICGLDFCVLDFMPGY